MNGSTTGLFGNSNNNLQSTGLFGNNNAASTGLFENSNSQSTGGLFGNINNNTGFKCKIFYFYFNYNLINFLIGWKRFSKGYK
jgi:hypothetical protein